MTVLVGESEQPHLPQIATTTINNTPILHVVWTKNYVGDLYYLQYRNGWQPSPSQLTTTNNANEPQIATSSDGRVGVIYQQGNSSVYLECVCTVSTSNWGQAHSEDNAYVPDLTFDTSLKAHAVWHPSTLDLSSIYSARSAGGQWSVPQNIGAAPANNSSAAQPAMAAGAPDNIYVAWSARDLTLNQGTLYYTHWDGVAWSSVSVLGGATPYVIDVRPSLAIDGLGKAHIAWEGEDLNSSLILYSESRIRGDVDMSISASSNQVSVGQRLTYTLIVSNVGNAPATNVKLTDTLPAHVLLGPVEPSVGTTCSAGGNLYVGHEVNCTVAQLNPGNAALVVIVITPTVAITPNVSEGNFGVIANIARVASVGAELSFVRSVSVTLPVAFRQMGACQLDRYYDAQSAQGSHFRIYFTFSPLNTTVANRPCNLELQPPARPNEPLPQSLLFNSNGYPEFVVELGRGLEHSHNYYLNQLNYPVGRIPLESDSGRFPIFIVGDTFFKCPFNILASSDGCYGQAGGFALPFSIQIPRPSSRQQVNYAVNGNVALPVNWTRSLGSHEFFHIIQWTYIRSALGSTGQQTEWTLNGSIRWWLEATAVWAEPHAYPQNGWYPGLLDELLKEPYAGMSTQPIAGVHGRAYGSFIFARHLESNVAAQRPGTPTDIIRKTWERYEANHGGDMLATIDQVLQQAPYNTSLRDQYLEFARYNYFLNGDVYTQNVTVHLQPSQVMMPLTTQPEWQLFRSKLDGDRRNYQNSNAAVAIDSRELGLGNNYHVVGNSSNYTRTVDAYGTGYVEFYPQDLQGVVNATLVVTVTAFDPALDRVKVSALPIRAGSFNNGPHPQNAFVEPQALPPTYALVQYQIYVTHFEQCDRATLLINAFTATTYNYVADVVLQPLPAPGPEVRVVLCAP